MYTRLEKRKKGGRPGRESTAREAQTVRSQADSEPTNPPAVSSTVISRSTETDSIRWDPTEGCGPVETVGGDLMMAYCPGTACPIGSLLVPSR